MTGRRLGDRYELVERIGTGGMAEVWRAVDSSLGREVAVKLLHPHLAQDESILARFRSEAQSAARLTHPGIVAIFDTVTTPTTDAIVMELVTGEDLRSILDQRGTLAIEDAVEVTMQLAQALGHAHQHGIVHRDVKPANVIVRPDRRIKLSDFGIAKALGDTTLTDSGSLVGTVKYLAPEQIEGNPIDGRTDLYSLSIVLFEMVTGSVPFPSSDIAAAVDRIKRVAPRASTIKPDIPPGLDEFLARSLSRDPADRPADALTYAASLAATIRRDTTKISPRPGTSTPISRPTAPAGSAAGGHPTAPPSSSTTPSKPGVAASPPKPDRWSARPSSSPSIPMRSPKPPKQEKPARKRRRRKRDLMWPLLAAALMIAALVVVWILLRPASDVVTDRLQDQQSSVEAGQDDEPVGTTGDTETTDGQADDSADGTTTDPAAETSTTASEIIEFADGIRISAFDPEGADGEHDDLAALVVDGDESTFWKTQLYNTRQFGGIKSGVGLIIEFQDPTEVRELQTLTNHAGWSARLYEADGPQPTLAAWAEPIRFYEDIPTDAVLEVPQMSASALLLWITDLGVSPDGGEEAEASEEAAGPSVRLEVFEIDVIP